MGRTQDVWPAGGLWVFQGTVAEDATAGTHVVSLTVTPGRGNEIEFLYGGIVVGNTATAQTATIFIDDGTNVIAKFDSVAFTAAVTELWVPGPGQKATAAGTFGFNSAGPRYIISGTMRLIERVTTTAISVTQTFAVAARLKTSQVPTATLADTVGVSTNTTNTNAVF